MKTKVILSALAALLGTSVNAQVFSSSFELWTNDLPDNWMGSTTNLPDANIIQSSDAQDGTYSCQIINETSNHKRFTTSSVTVTSGSVYEISFWAKGSGEVRTAVVIEPSNYSDYTSYVTLTGNWTQYTQTVIIPADGNAQFIFSVRNSVAPDHILLDNVVITESASTTTTIYDVQNTTDPSGDSPMVGQVVTVNGIVTGTYSTSATLNGYFLQDGDGAWNGIHVFTATNTNLPTIGDDLTITGTVAEYFGLTQITSVGETVVNSQGNTLPNATIVTSSEVNDEMYEGVLVQVNNAECTDANSGFGMWRINNDIDSAKVHDLMFDYSPVLGAIYDIRGVVNFAFDEFRICPRDINDITVIDDNTTEATIYEIQSDVDVEGNSNLVDMFVTTAGVVTGIWPGDGFFIQDGSGPWSGIFVFNNTISTNIGDSIRLTGRVVEYFGFTQLSSISFHEIVSSDNDLPPYTILPANSISQEQYESVLIRLENVVCTNPSAGFGSWDVTDQSGNANIATGNNDIYLFSPTQGTIYNVNGPVFYSFGTYKVLPRSASDIEAVLGMTEEQLNAISIYPNPASDVLTVNGAEGANVTVTDAQGKTVYSSTMSNTVETINVENLESGIYFINFEGNKTMKFIVK